MSLEFLYEKELVWGLNMSPELNKTRPSFNKIGFLRSLSTFIFSNFPFAKLEFAENWITKIINKIETQTICTILLELFSTIIQTPYTSEVLYKFLIVFATG